MKPVSDLHAAALRFAGAGIPVFPCIPGTKKPACDNGFHDATTDVSTINAWWTEEPRLNVAFSPHQAGLGIIDLDGDEGEASWEKWQDENARLAPTYTIRTPRGGRHLYYRGILPATQSKLGVHVDTRGVGSYALIPPSKVGGGSYTLLDSRSPVDLDPSVNEFLDRLKRERVKAASADLDKPENIARARRLLLDYVARGHVAVEGQMGDNRTFVTACEVMNLGLNAETAFELLCEIWNPACLPPWDEEELETKVENAARYAQNEAGAWAVGSSQDVFGSALDKLAPGDLADDPPPSPKRRRFRFYSPAELRNLPPPSFLLPELLPEKGLSMLYGPPSSYKTFAAIHWAHQLASVGVPVAYVAGEGYIGVNQRAQAWRLAHDVPDDVPFYLSKQAPSADDGEESLDFLQELEPLKPALVVIDTLARASGGLNENDARDMNQFVRFLDKIREVLDCAILVIHHTGKDDSRGARGSNALTGAIDAAFEVKADKRTKSVAVWCRRQKDAPEREEPWCFEGRDVAGQMVLQPIKHTDYVALTRVNDALSPKEVGGLLRSMGAVGEENGITTHALAFELVHRGDPDLPEETKDTMILRQTRVLGKLAQKSLEAYCIGSGSAMLWFVP
jgi:hypothetical protein